MERFKQLEIMQNSVNNFIMAYYESIKVHWMSFISKII